MKRKIIFISNAVHFITILYTKEGRIMLQNNFLSTPKEAQQWKK
ncbi:hypothetical protein [Virgibacillus sp. 6R]|nr:hypothetical protein [Virgibacillus sp. 6R]